MKTGFSFVQLLDGVATAVPDRGDTWPDEAWPDRAGPDRAGPDRAAPDTIGHTTIRPLMTRGGEPLTDRRNRAFRRGGLPFRT